ncbi:MAG: response regulator [Lachnospiraceae bacterium]|nr:response regulator [Lachnospiraceae bacterium]
MGEKKKKRSWLHYSFIATLVLAVVCMLGMMMWQFRDLTKKQEQIIGREQLEIVSGDLQKVLADAEIDMWHVVGGMERLLKNKAGENALMRYCVNQKIALESEACFNVYVGGEGWHVIPGFDGGLDFDVQERVWYQGAMKVGYGKAYISSPYIDAASGDMCFTVSTVLEDGTSVVGLDYHLHPVQQCIKEVSNEMGGDTLIVSEDGQVVGYADESLVGKNITEVLPQYANAFQRIISSGNDNMSFDTKIGRKTVRVFYSSTENGWYILSFSGNVTHNRSGYLWSYIFAGLTGVLLLVMAVLCMYSYDRMRREHKEREKDAAFHRERAAELRQKIMRVLSYSNYDKLKESEEPREFMGKLRGYGITLDDCVEDIERYLDNRGFKEEKKKRKEILVEKFRDDRSRILVVGIFITLIITMFVSIFISSRAMMEGGNNRMKAEAENYVHELDVWIAEQKSLLDMFASNISANPDIMDNYDEAVKWLDKMTVQYKQISATHMTDTAENHTVITNNGWQPDDSFHVEERQWYIDTMNSEAERGFSISSPYFDLQTGLYCITLSERVYDAEGNFLGVFGIDFYLDKLTKILSDSYSEEGYAFLADKDGNIINHPNKKYELTTEGSVSVEKAGYLEVIYSDEPVTIRDYDNEKRVAFARIDEKTGFSIVALKNWDVIYGSILKYDAFLVLMFGVCIVIIVYMIRQMLHWQKKSNEALQESVKEAKRAGEAKTNFLARMSHEIRTPINAVLGMDEMILRESKEKAIRGYAADIMSAGRTLVSIINDILDLSKVEAGRLEIVPVRYDLTSLVNDLVNLTRDRAVKKGLSFHLDVDPKTPHMLYGDEIRIKQCAMNLLTNAIQYTDKGSVTLRVSFRKMERSAAGADRFFLKITVEDTGVGMNKEDMDSLFSPYLPLDERKSKGLEGTGLGMSITRQLLDLMHGELHAESEMGKGSVFSFEVEQEVSSWEEIGDYTERFSISEGDVAVYHELFHAPDARILVVDDMEMNITVMEGLLKQTGIRIDSALSGEDALTLAATNDYDVIFIDHMMPEMDGIEILKRLRESGGKNADTPTVCLTANAVSGARETYLEAGFNRYMSKPIDGAELESMLCELLPGQKVRRDVLTTTVRPADAQEKPRVLVVDDDESLCALVRSILEKDYDISVSNTVEDGVKTALEVRPDLILLDLYLTDGTGFDVMQRLREDERTAGIPFLLLTGDNDSVTEEKGFKSGASDYIRKPFVPDVLKQRTKRIVDLRRYQQSIEEEVERQTSRSRRLTRDMMLALSKTVDTKDHYTDGHSRRVAAICAEIGRRMGMSDADQIKLYEIGLLHDIGKIGIHEDIIHKNTRLSDEEFAEVKAHTIKGYEILKEITDMPKLREGARWHHERYDGSGYPDHLKGEEIPEVARIACIADCYDAMTSTRTYSVPKPQSEVRAEILRCRGKWFDPKIADVMLQMIDEDKDYKMNEHASGSDVWKRYDKLWEFQDVIITPPPSKPVPAPVIAELPADLERIPDMDTEKGIKNCGSVEGYLSVLSVFHRTAAAKLEEIEEAFRTGNVADYTIRVHALKSSARIIGASVLSALAEKLEKAGKERDMDTIVSETGKLLKMYRKLNADLGAMDESGSGKPLISGAEMKEAYQTLLEIAESMDYGLLEGLLKDLEKYELPIDDENNLTSLEMMMTELNWEGIASLAREALNQT